MHPLLMCGPVDVLAQATLQKSLANYLVEPNLSAAVDPATSAACFSKYIPILTEVANTYSVQYQACVTTAEQSTLNLTNQAAASKATFMQETQAICTGFQTCDNDTDVLSAFNCYASASQADVSQIYDISNNAAIAASTLSQGLAQIKNNEDECTNATQRTYVTDTASTYELLDYCLQNGLSTDDTTVEPSTTTVASSSIVAVSSTSPTVVANAVNDIVVQEEQTSADGSQSQSQSGTGTQSQSQCSGSNCGEFKPYAPLFKMPEFAPFN